MSIFYCRLTTIILLIYCIFNPSFLYIYVLAMHFSIEMLNQNKTYQDQKNKKLLNLVFISYSVLIFNRELNLNIEPVYKQIINRTEHIIFAFVISLKFFQYFRFISIQKLSFNFRILLCCFGFQLIGLLNEVFQTSYGKGSFSIYLSADAVHDLVTNSIGSGFFVLLAFMVKSKVPTKVFARKS